MIKKGIYKIRVIKGDEIDERRAEEGARSSILPM